MHLHMMRDGNTITVDKIIRVGPIIPSSVIEVISSKYTYREHAHFMIHFDHGQTYKVSNYSEAELMTDRNEIIDYMRKVEL